MRTKYPEQLEIKFQDAQHQLMFQEAMQFTRADQHTTQSKPNKWLNGTRGLKEKHGQGDRRINENSGDKYMKGERHRDRQR